MLSTLKLTFTIGIDEITVTKYKPRFSESSWGSRSD